MKTLQNSTRNWKTTLIGVLIILSWICNSLLAWLQTGAMPSIESAVTAWTVGTGFILAKDGDKSGVTKVLLLMPCMLLLAACSTNAAGDKTFLLLTSKDWKVVAAEAGREAGKTVLHNWEDKAVKQVNPANASGSTPWATIMVPEGERVGGWFSGLINLF